MNKRKILNDPVYGFVTIPFDFIFDLLEHPWFQRLRRIRQLGLTHYVYPGALHTRFNHALGALHLMGQALDVLRFKGAEISVEESEAVSIAILMHDMGHGPYSHTLERVIIPFLSHEQLTLFAMEKMEKEFPGKFRMAIEIFKGIYPKKFLHQLVSSQLDMDRLDYLNRDSFFTGVYEGVIGYDRIIKMLVVHQGELMVESKGIYSVEKFIIARRLMYWQVYLHKTVLAAEQMLPRLFSHARRSAQNGKQLFSTPALRFFLYEKLEESRIDLDEVLEKFMNLDDHDLFASIKGWATEDDKDSSLARLSRMLVNRRLPALILQRDPFPAGLVSRLKDELVRKWGITEEESESFIFTDSTSNHAYSRESGSIKILFRDGRTVDLADASDQLNISVLSHPVVKYYLCFPKDLGHLIH